MQYGDDTALERAILSAERVITRRVLFDWYTDGAFEHAYSDLSAVCSRVSWDRQLSSDLPRKVNTITGFASAEAKLTLAGTRAADDTPVTTLFSPYKVDSPIYGRDIVGVPLRIEQVVRTTDGMRTIRRFTGWIRDYAVKQSTGEVTITASDNLDIANSMATLPLWAVEMSRDPGPVAAGRPGSMTWVIEELCRQAGRPTGPVPRSDCKAYVSCNGTFIPSVGNWAQFYEDYWYNHTITQGADVPWANGLYGLCPVPTAGDSHFNRNSSRFHTAGDQIIVPQADSGWEDSTIGFAGWVYVYSPTTGLNEPSTWLTLFLGDQEYIPDRDNGRIEVRFYPSGGARAVVFEDGKLPTPRVWETRFTQSQPVGWHYIAVHVNVRYWGIDAQLWVDDQPVPYATATGSGGYRYYRPLEIGRRNIFNFDTKIYCQHVQCYTTRGNNATQYRPGQQHPPTREGRPLAQVGTSFAEVAWLPDVYKANAWDTLKAVAGSEYGGLHTDEYGTLHFLSHPALRNETTAAVSSAVYVDDDTLQDMQVNPSDDQYANAVSISSNFKWAKQSVVWQAQGALDHYVSPDEGTKLRTYGLDDVVTINSNATPIPADPPAGGPSITQSTAAAIRADNWAVGSPNGWAWSVVANEDQRSMDIRWSAGYAGTAVFVGATYNAQSPAMSIAGRKYSDADMWRDIAYDAAEVTRRGMRVLELSDDEWRQTPQTALSIAGDLLKDTVTPAPVVDGITIPADPRLQLRDVLAINSAGSTTGKIFAQIIGIASSDDDSGAQDTLTVRVVKTPGQWILDDPQLSILDDTTILS